jgi:coenzyme PQQ precursor peptide PqqA
MRAPRPVATKCGECQPVPGSVGNGRRAGEWAWACFGIEVALQQGRLVAAEGGDKPVIIPYANYRRLTMQWTAPSFTDLRFGFEITMYIANR